MNWLSVLRDREDGFRDEEHDRYLQKIAFNFMTSL